MKALDFVLENARNRILLQQQLIKDFAQLGQEFPVDFAENPVSLTDLEQAVRELTVAIMEQGEPKLLQLLYFIDIPEKHFLALLGQEHFLPELIQKIIYREAEKVYFRQKFSS